MHAPPGVQHVPCGGCGQMLGVHVPPVVHVEPAEQLICVTNVHVPVCVTQQVPCCGCGHGFGVHVLGGPTVQTFVPVQLT